MRKFFHNRSIWVIWLLSYMLILCVPLVVTSFMVQETTALTEEKVLALSESNLARTQESLDRMFSDIRSIARDIMTRNHTLSLQYAKIPLTATKLEKIGQLQTELRSKVAHNQTIREIYVYFRHSQIVASSKEYLGIVGAFEPFALKRFSLASEATQKMIAARKDMYVSLMGAGPEVTDMVALVSSSYGDDPDMLFLFVLDPPKFRQVLSDKTEGTPVLWAQSEEGKVLASFDTLSFQNGETADAVMLASGLLKNSEVVTTEVLSPLTGWRFFSAMAAHQFQAPRHVIWRSYLLCFFCSLLVGIPFSVYFAKRNYKPVKKMTEQLRVDATGAEYDAIDTALRALIESEQESNWRVRAQGQALREAVLSRIMHGKFSSAAQLLSMCKDCGILCPTESFLFIGVYVYSFGSYLGQVPNEGQDDEGAENEELLRYIISSVTEESLAECANAYAFSCDETVYCLVCPRSDGDISAEFLKKLYDICQTAARFVLERADLTIGYYLSDLYHEKEDTAKAVHNAAQDVLWGVGLMENLQQGGVFTRAMLVEATEDFAGDSGAQMSIAKRTQYAQAIVKGDFAQADKLYASLHYASALSSEHSLANAKGATAVLLNTVIEQALTSLEQANHRPTLETLTAAVMQAKDAPGLRQAMKDAAMQLHSLVNQKDAMASDALYEDILRYIAAHYREQELSVSSVCDAFKLSASAMLKLFKQCCATSVFDAIQQERMNAAQALLRHSNETIEQIALSCGYGNTLSLIRAFKRMQGMTPTAYRQSVNRD
jgi:AraC-type DNA-binding domain-containing proteins